MKQKEVENICGIIHKEAEELINSIPDKTSVSKFEAFIKKYPLLQFVDRWEISNNSETIINYIKGVCND